MTMAANEPPAKIRKLEHDSSRASDAKPSTSESIDTDAMTDREASPIIAIPGDGPFMSGAIPLGEEVLREGSPPPKSETAAESAPMSKNQMKKLRRRQQWEAQTQNRKDRRKEKKKAKQEQKQEERKRIESGVRADGMEGAAESEAGGHPHGAGRAKRARRAQQLPVTFVYDCGWDELMNDKEIVSLSSQLTRCYADNSRAPFRAHLVVSSYGGRLKERFVNVLRSNNESWKGTRFTEHDFAHVAEQQAHEWMMPAPGQGGGGGGRLCGPFERADEQEALLRREVVYLSSDADDTLAELRPYSVYVVGGLVDKNRHKGVCHRRARERGVRTAKLPLGSYVDMASRKILTVNHVSEIMLRWLEYGDWGKAFEAVLPKRKGAVLKGAAPEAGDEAAAESGPEGEMDKLSTDDHSGDDEKDLDDEDENEEEGEGGKQ